MHKFYSSIKFPIEQDFSEEYKYFYETITLLRFTIIKFLKFLEPIILIIIGVNRLFDRKWPTYSEKKKPNKLCVVNPFLVLDHSHVMNTTFSSRIELNHFIYILYRKVKLTGNKSVYPDCLNNNFALKATYEISNFIQKNVFKSKFRVRIDQLFFSDTNSFNSLLEGRRILGKIKSQDYNYLMKHY
jgi:hypothetical protein